MGFCKFVKEMLSVGDIGQGLTIQDLQVLNFIPSAETDCGLTAGTLGTAGNKNDDSTDDDDKAVSDDDDKQSTNDDSSDDDDKAVSDDDDNRAQPVTIVPTTMIRKLVTIVPTTTIKRALGTTMTTTTIRVMRLLSLELA